MKKKITVTLFTISLLLVSMFVTYQAKAQVNVPLPAKIMKTDTGRFVVFCPDVTGGDICIVRIPIL